MPRPPRQQKLTLSLLKEATTRTGALRNPESLDSYTVPALSRSEDSLFLKWTPPHPPGWMRYLEPHVSEDLPDLYAASSGAVLFVESSRRLFAVTFGQGRHLLEPETLESDFGLKVVLNSVAPDQLKSVDAKTIDETTMHTRRDVSRDSSLSALWS